MLITGGFLSTLLPLIGPAVVQPPSLLHTWRLVVAAFALLGGGRFSADAFLTIHNATHPSAKS